MSTAGDRTVDLDEYARQLVAEWPPLTPDQLERISGLLAGGAA